MEYPVRFVEGWTFRQMIAALDEAPKLTRTLSGLPPQEIMMRLGYPNVHPEGRFYPDTYNYSAGRQDHTILAKAFEKIRERSRARVGKPRTRTCREVSGRGALILGLDCRKRTGRADERPLIAGGVR